jgi:hypothetical protein
VSQSELLRRVVAVLEEVGIDYMITGSLASSLQGEPRSTHDIDVVVQISASQVAELIRAFPPPTFYISEDAVKQALQSAGMFNLLAGEEGDKVDFWLVTQEAFDQSRFSRKYVEEVFGLALKVSSPEDTILQKLKWVKLTGGSERSFLDAVRVYEVQHGVLDLEYINEWASRLQVVDLWRRLQMEAEPIA